MTDKPPGVANYSQPGEFAAVAESQRRYFGDFLPTRILRAEPLDSMGSTMTAGALRAFAKATPAEAKRGPGRPPKWKGPQRVCEYVAARLQSPVDLPTLRAELERVATLAERGETLAEPDRFYAAAALREFAKTIPTKEPRGKGRPPEWQAPSEAVVFVSEVARGKSRYRAALEVAERNNVSRNIAERGLAKHEKAARALLRALGATLPDE